MTGISRLNVLLPGLYAWGVTVLVPVFSTGASAWAVLVAVAALACLGVGTWAVGPRPRLARLLGIYGFIGCSVLCWVLLGDPLVENRFNPVRGASGALAWALFAFGWGRVRPRGRVPEEDPRAERSGRLDRHGRLPRGAVLVLLLTVVAAVVPVCLAWREVRPEHAVLAHAVALLAALGLMFVGPRVAVDLGRARVMGPPSERLNNASTALTLLGLAAVLGLLLQLI